LFSCVVFSGPYASLPSNWISSVRAYGSVVLLVVKCESICFRSPDSHRRFFFCVQCFTSSFPGFLFNFSPVNFSFGLDVARSWSFLTPFFLEDHLSSLFPPLDFFFFFKICRFSNSFLPQKEWVTLPCPSLHSTFTSKSVPPFCVETWFFSPFVFPFRSPI